MLNGQIEKRISIWKNKETAPWKPTANNQEIKAKELDYISLKQITTLRTPADITNGEYFGKKLSQD